MNFSMDELNSLAQLYGIKLVQALATLVIGLLVAKLIASGFRKLITQKKFDKTLSSFVFSMTKALLYTIVGIMTLSQLGVETTSLIAVLGAAGLAISFALQGSLSNFAAGIMLIVFRHFKVGDFIDGAGVSGTVEEIKIFTTNLKTPDNKLIIIPNSKLVNDNLINYSAKSTRRVDMVFGISYNDDIDKAKNVISSLIKSEARILLEPAPQIVVSSLGDSSVNITVRTWVKKEDYWDVYFSMTENVKKRFDNEQISIPFPQTDVHIHQN